MSYESRSRHLTRRGLPLQEFKDWRTTPLVTKTSREDCDFPVDRSLAGRPSGRSQVAINIPADREIGTREIGFAVLFIFSRMLDQNKLRVRLLRGAMGPLHIAADIPP